MAFSWKSFLVGALVVAVPAGWVIHKIDARTSQDAAELILPSKIFVDPRGSAEGYTLVSGSISGEGLAYPNNYFRAACSQSEMVCRTAEIDQIGDYQLGDIDADEFKITEWNGALIRAESEPTSIQCNKVILNIVRSTETVQYIRVPINETQPNCANGDHRTFYWTLQDSLWHRRIDAEIKALKK